MIHYLSKVTSAGAP